MLDPVFNLPYSEVRSSNHIQSLYTVDAVALPFDFFDVSSSRACGERFPANRQISREKLFFKLKTGEEVVWTVHRTDGGQSAMVISIAAHSDGLAKARGSKHILRRRGRCTATG